MSTPVESTPADEKYKDAGRQFICGVVEGFYGRPWTTEQRKDLFAKLKSWGTNSYLYAPKDDCKHRAYWREPYTVDEAEHLQSLISLAADCDIDFYYAISPGLDIIYSSSKEVASLKRKLEQVAQLGCKAFALLFDDIEPEMCKQDKEVFQSFAHAQVSITNEIFQHLGQPKFLFCPTQYCSARAVPTVRNSEYLNTIGSKLAPEIQIMWTGDKVISKNITLKNLEDINEVLKRHCVIWDNEHANDYDQKRVFLGPYSGRSPEIKSKLAGVMTNPNCEYGANFVGIHTLAQWSQCDVDGTLPAAASDAVSSDIKLESEGEDTNGDFANIGSLPPNVYHPRHALLNALRDWLPEFSRQKTVWGPMSKPQVGLGQPTTLAPTVNTCIAPTNTTTVGTTGSSNPAETTVGPVAPIPDAIVNSPPVSPSLPLTPSSSGADTVLSSANLKDVNVDSSAMQPITLPVMNSLVSTNKVVMDITIDAEMTTDLPPDAAQNPLDFLPKVPLALKDSDVPVKTIQLASQPAVLPKLVTGPTYLEPMDCLPLADISGDSTKIIDTPMESATSPPTPASVMQEDVDSSNLVKSESSTMLYESSVSEPMRKCDSTDLDKDDGQKDVDALTTKDLHLLVQLFYLPSEHGQAGLELLNEFYWLKRNGCAMLAPGSLGAGSKEEREEWQRRAANFDRIVNEVQMLFEKVCSCQNRELVYDIYTYVWDMCGVLLTLNGFVHWLAKGSCSPKLQSYVVGQQTWFSGIREAFVSGDNEPWVFRGGLISDLIRLLPLDSGHDLYIYRYPEVPANVLHRLRPFEARDEKEVYALAANAYEEEIEAPMGLCESDRIVVGDRRVGAYLTLCPEYCFVCESSIDGSIVGFACTAPDAAVFCNRHNVAWVPEMRLKYPRKQSLTIEESMLSPLEEMMLSFHVEEEVERVPACLESSCLPTAAAGSPMPWGLVKMYVAPSPCQQDPSLSKRLTMLAMACLRASGTIRAYTEVPVADVKIRELYSSLGFASANVSDPDAKVAFLTRVF